MLQAESDRLTSLVDASADWPPRAPVRAVVFDVVGTLIEPDPPVASSYRRAGLRHGIDLELAVIRERFAAAWTRQERLDAAGIPPFATNPLREEERWRGIVQDVFGRGPDVEGVFQDLWEHFGRGESWRPTPWAERIVWEARASGMEVALASNFDERLFLVASRIPPLTRFRNVYASSELGWRKPAAAFFRAVEERLGLAPDELLLVGDDPQLDLEAAARAGWRVRGLP